MGGGVAGYRDREALRAHSPIEPREILINKINRDFHFQPVSRAENKVGKDSVDLIKRK